MAGTTSKGLRYPTAGDNPAVHTDFLNLAGDIDTLLDSYVGTANLVNLTFEGSTADAFETILTVVDPSTDRTITLPDATGTVALLAAGTNKITGLGDASESTDTDAVNVKTALNLARTQMLMLGGM